MTIAYGGLGGGVWGDSANPGAYNAVLFTLPTGALGVGVVASWQGGVSLSVTSGTIVTNQGFTVGSGTTSWVLQLYVWYGGNLYLDNSIRPIGTLYQGMYFTGVDLSAPLIQNSGWQSGASTTLSAFTSVHDATVAVAFGTASGSISAGSGWTDGGSGGSTATFPNPDGHLYAEYNLSNDTSPDVTSTTSNKTIWAGELRAAPQSISGVGAIASGETFGTSSWSGSLTMQGIASLEAFGVPLTQNRRLPGAPVGRGPARSWTDEQLADLVEGVGQRFETYRFDVLRPDLSYEFTLQTVDADNPPSIDWDATSSTQRTLHGLNISPKEINSIDPLTHRLAAYMQFDTGRLWPLGVFLFANPHEKVSSYGHWLNSDLMDQSVILNQGREAAFGIDAGSQILPAMQLMIDELGLTARASIDPTLVTLSPDAPHSWAAGTTRGKILGDLCTAAGFYPPYFDGLGWLRLRAVPYPLSAAPADLFFDETNSRILSDSIDVSNNLNTAPNRYIVTGPALSTAEIVGIYDIPPSAPHSFQHRGFHVVAPPVQNALVTDNASAIAAAHALYANDFSAYEQIEFSTAPEPRVGGYQVMDVIGTKYRVQSWSLTCSPGSEHRHTGRAIYNEY